MRRSRLIVALMLCLFVLAACGRDDYGSDADHRNHPDRMNHDRPDPAPSK